jgi:hypothetical protein
MRGYGATGLFAGFPEAVDHVLGISRFASKSASAKLTQTGLSTSASMLVPAMIEAIEHNWASALQSRSHSDKNFRWHSPQLELAEHNCSREVSFERTLVRALAVRNRKDWSNQIPLVSGIGGPHAFKRRAVDLARDWGDGCFEFVELKIDSDTPLFAAIEILVYGLLWLLCRRDRVRLGYSSANPILDAQRLRLSVLAPYIYYANCPRGLAIVINDGLRTVASRHGVAMDFRFTAFPAGFYWSSDPTDPRKPPAADLIAMLDGREDL